MYYQGNVLNYTSGTFYAHYYRRFFSPSSGNGQFISNYIRNTINQTGGANGATRSLYINDDLVSAANHRAIDINNNSGYAIYQGGSGASSFFNGYIHAAAGLRAGLTNATGDVVTIDGNNDLRRRTISQFASDIGGPYHPLHSNSTVYVANVSGLNLNAQFSNKNVFVTSGTGRPGGAGDVNGYLSVYGVNSSNAYQTYFTYTGLFYIRNYTSSAWSNWHKILTDENISDASITNWNIAATNQHVHANKTTLDTVNAGSYTPTITDVSNILDSGVVGEWQYTRIANIVSFTGLITINLTGGGNGVLRCSLPVASNFSESYDVVALGMHGYNFCLVAADVSNNEIEITALAGGGGTATVTGKYIIK